MSILGLFTSLGISKTIDADNNEGFYIHPEKFGVSRNTGPLDPSRTTANVGEWFVANISSRVVVDANTVKFICTIPPNSTVVSEYIREVYIYAKDSLNNDFLLALGQPTETILYDPDGTITLELQITLADIDLTANYIFNYTQATELAEHVTDPAAHLEISEAMAKAGIFVTGGSIPFDYVGQTFDQIVEFEGTKAFVNYGGLTFSALYNGTEQNGIVLNFDNIKDSDTIVTEWNNANPNQMIGHNGLGTEVLAVGSATLVGGTYIVQENNLVYRDTDGVYKQALADGSIKAKVVGMALRSKRRVVHQGLMTFTSGQPISTTLYLSSSVLGGFQTINNGISLGIVLKSNLILFTGFTSASTNVSINQDFDAIVTNDAGVGFYPTTQQAINACPSIGRILIDKMEEVQATITTGAKKIEFVANGVDKGWKKFAGQAEIQKIEFSAIPTSGTWRIEWNAQETTDLAYNCSALDVQNAFNILAGHNGVTVSGNFTTGFVITFDLNNYTLPTFLNPGLNEIQRFNLGNVPDNGTVQFEHNGQFTANYAWNDTTAQLEAYLEALSTIADVTVSGSFAAQYFQIEFVTTDGLQNRNYINVSALTLKQGLSNTLVNGSYTPVIPAIVLQEGKYPASNLKIGATPIVISSSYQQVGDDPGPDTLMTLGADNQKFEGLALIQDFAKGIVFNGTKGHKLSLHFVNTAVPIVSENQVPGVGYVTNDVIGFAQDVFSQLKLTQHSSNKKRVVLSGADQILASGVTLAEGLDELLMSFDGAQLDFDTGIIYKADGVTSLGVNFTAPVITSQMYKWYAISIAVNSISGDNKHIAHVNVNPASGEGSTISNAPKAQFGYGKAIGQVVVQGSYGLPEITEIKTIADFSTSLTGTFFKLFDNAGSVGFWIDVNNGGTPIPAGALACTRNVEITTITTNMTATQVATQVKNAIDADAQFIATVSANRITVTDAAIGTRTDATPETSGFFFSVIQQGVNVDPSGIQDILNSQFMQVSTGSDHTNKIRRYSSEANFVTAKGSPATDGDHFIDTGINKLKIFVAGAWRTAAGDYTPSTVTANTTMAVGGLYVCDSASLLDMKLPQTANLGDRIQIIGMGTGKFRIVTHEVAATQRINEGQYESDTSALTSIPVYKSLQRYGSVEIVCSVANTRWTVVNDIDGEIIGDYNTWGDGSDGIFVSSSSTLLPNTLDGDVVVKQYTDFTLNLGHEFTTQNSCRGLAVYVRGNCIINGDFNMNGKGCKANPNDTVITSSTPVPPSDGNAVPSTGIVVRRKKLGGTTQNNDLNLFFGCGLAAKNIEANQKVLDLANQGIVIVIAKVGNTGGAAVSAGADQFFNGNTGGSGGSGFSGGGGSGGVFGSGANGVITSGAGATGTCFSGGSGGGGGSKRTPGAGSFSAGSGVAFGGKGGDAFDIGGSGGVSKTGGGSGNPGGSGLSGGANGANGTGGLIFLFVRGTLTIGPSGSIGAKGKNGGSTGSPTGGGAGAASGGGNIVVLHAGALSNSGTISAAGGLGGISETGTANGGNGGSGSINGPTLISL